VGAGAGGLAHRVWPDQEHVRASRVTRPRYGIRGDFSPSRHRLLSQQHALGPKLIRLGERATRQIWCAAFAVVSAPSSRAEFSALLQAGDEGLLGAVRGLLR